MATHLGLTQAAYSSMERGQQRVYVDYLIIIAKSIGVDIWELFVDDAQTAALDKEAMEFMKMWRRFDKAERDTLKAVAEQICQKKDLEISDPQSDCGESVLCGDEEKKKAVRTG